VFPLPACPSEDPVGDPERSGRKVRSGEGVPETREMSEGRAMSCPSMRRIPSQRREKPMRLLTRSDYDGLMCAVLLKELGKFDRIKFVHPKDLQDGLVPVGPEDMLVNVPFVPGCGWWFDHHASESVRGAFRGYLFQGESRPAPSCARVIYEFFGGDGTLGRFAEMVDAADKSDSADFTVQDILHPRRWVLLSFVMDPRTGLGRWQNYRISNYRLMEELVEALRLHGVEDILALPDVVERTTRYFEQDLLFRAMLLDHSRQEGDAVVTDLRGIPETYVGNRHMIYALFPEANIDVRIFDGKDRQFCVFAVGHSVINRSSRVDVGGLMLRYGGGGHWAVGTCQVPYEEADRILGEILREINPE
jgi:hypothetical protein